MWLASSWLQSKKILMGKPPAKLQRKRFSPRLSVVRLWMFKLGRSQLPSTVAWSGIVRAPTHVIPSGGCVATLAAAKYRA
jgi:hypothetical protein